MIKKAVLPIAGLGTRFLPVTKGVPKEMLPIIDKPVIQYLVEEAADSGVEEVIMVVNDNNEATRKYFTKDEEFEKIIHDKGRAHLIESLQDLLNRVKFTYVRQEQPLGDGHAVLQAKDAVGDEPFLVLFGDDLVDGPRPAAKQLMDIYDNYKTCVIALEKISSEKTDQYGVIKSKGDSNGFIHEIESLVEKPHPDEAPSNLGIIGKYICTPDIFAKLETAESGTADNEIRLIDGFRALISEKSIYGYEIEGDRYDTGNPAGLLRAAVAFSKKREDIRID